MRSAVGSLTAVGLILGMGIFMSGCEGDSSSTTPAAEPTTTTATPALVAPTQIAPANGESINHFPRSTTLVWSTVPGAAKYGVEVEYTDGTWHSLTSATPTDPTYTFNFVGMQTGRWRVWAIDADNNAGPKSGWFEFTYTI